MVPFVPIMGKYVHLPLRQGCYSPKCTSCLCAPCICNQRPTIVASNTGVPPRCPGSSNHKRRMCTYLLIHRSCSHFDSSIAQHFLYLLVYQLELAATLGPVPRSTYKICE